MKADTSKLNTVQRWMMSALIEPGKASQALLDEILLPGAMLDAASCFAIYQRSYILRLCQCLAEQFPATRYALGDTLFNDFACNYLRDCPSKSYTLYELGRHFTGWLEQTRPDRDEPEREEWIDFMVDLAHYEREIFRLFDAPGHEGQPWPDIDTDDSELILQPALVLAQYQYPVAWYYHEVRARRNPSFPARLSQHVAILRRDYQTTTYPISALHHRFLTSIQRSGSIDCALRDIAAWTQCSLETVTQSWVTEVRRAWIEAGFFIAVNA